MWPSLDDQRTLARHDTALHRVHTFAQLTDLLEQAGFVDVELYGSPADEPYALGSGRLLLVARRA